MNKDMVKINSNKNNAKDWNIYESLSMNYLKKSLSAPFKPMGVVYLARASSLPDVIHFIRCIHDLMYQVHIMGRFRYTQGDMRKTFIT